jgi:biotin carboxylase
MSQNDITYLCLASYFKGGDFLRECKRQGCQTLLVTTPRLMEQDWPREAIDEIYAMPDLSKREDVIKGVSYLARFREIHRVIPLDDYDVEMAAELREHLRLPGMGNTTARYFRDKLAMRMQARDKGIPVPDFVHCLNHEHIRRFMNDVPPPWMLKPRSEAGSVGIRKVHSADEVWQALEQLGDLASFYVLERFVAGDIFHVDCVVDDRQVLFATAHQYGAPPHRIWTEGGIFKSWRLPQEGELTRRLLELNQRCLAAMGMVRGVTHGEFILDPQGQLYFLEVAARVGGAFLDQLVEAGSGINLWSEWARVEIAYFRGQKYQLPPHRDDYAGLLLCLARQEWPDTSHYTDPEVVRRVHRHHHAGLIVASPRYERVQELLDSYSQRFSQEFLAIQPPTDKPLA